MFINRCLISFARGHGRPVLAACALESSIAFLGTCVSLLLAIAAQMLMALGRFPLFSHVAQPLLCIAFLLVIRFIVIKRKTWTANQGSIRIKEGIRRRLVDKLLELGPAFTTRERTGDIASTISNKVEWLSNYYVLYLPTCASALLNSALILVILCSFDGVTALICALACVGMLGFPVLFYPIMRTRGLREWEAHSTYYSDCLDSIQGITTLKAFNANRERRRHIHEKGEELRQKVMGQLRITMLETGVLDFFIRFGSAFSVALVAMRSALGMIPSDHLVYVLFLATACFTPMMNLGNSWHMGYRGVTASYSIDEMLRQKALLALDTGARQEAQGAAAEIPQAVDIRFRDVCFSYQAEEGDILHSISFSVPEKTMTALVGPSGSGKSTIAHLLAGFYPVGSGAIEVGGTVLDETSVETVQGLISAVWQDSHIFYDTVYENIRMGRPDASPAEVIEAARKANLHEFVDGLPEGYDTHLGENGMRFSGGERQRLALARAFLKDSPLIIFDEATSSLDRKNERDIQDSFLKLRQGKTALVIAHRLSTIRQAEQICMVEAGRIVGFGTHEQLAGTSAAYRRLMGTQLIDGQGVRG